MSIRRFFTTPVTIVTPASVEDQNGDLRPDFDNPVSSKAAMGWLTQSSTSEQLGERDVVTTGQQLFLAAGTTITSIDRVQVEGKVFAVDGDPHRAKTPRGEHHVEVSLRRVADGAI